MHVSNTRVKDAPTSNENPLSVALILIDEFGTIARMAGDNLFAGSPVVVASEHHEIHCGDSYELGRIVNLVNGASTDILIIVPNEAVKRFHFIWSLEAEGEATATLYEGATVSANGTALSIFNRERNSSNVDYLGAYHTPTVTGTGTAIEQHKVGSGNKVGGSAGRADEWILKNNTTYLLRVANETAVNNWVDIKCDYYVHPGI